jgi:hypothetical protein
MLTCSWAISVVVASGSDLNIEEAVEAAEEFAADQAG